MRKHHTFHLLSVPHAVTVPEYSTCAFTQKVIKLARMLKMLGHTVIHYGHELSAVECDEHVTVTTNDDLTMSYGAHDWRTQGFPAFQHTDKIYQTFYALTIGEIHRRKKPGDFLLCPFGNMQQPVADAHPDLIVVESGVGYAGTFAKFKVYESYAVMHASYGAGRVQAAFADGWYDAVIPNCFDPDDFTYSEEKDPYFLFLGRVGEGKGVHIAADVTAAIGANLTIAGVGEPPVGDHIDYVGAVDPTRRRGLLAHAKAVLCPSMFVEPFCSVQIEAMLSGTPVISTDWGAFAEYNIHGKTGFRCRTREQFIWALENVSEIISPSVCRDYAIGNFSLEIVAMMYDEYFAGLHILHTDPSGWATENRTRTNLNWLNREFPR